MGDSGRISIARWAPRKTPAGFRIYKPLAPGLWFNKVTRPEYERLYTDQLGLLDPETVWADLHELAGEHEPVLLCWERPEDLISGKTFCHHRMVAEYFTARSAMRFLSMDTDVPVDREDTRYAILAPSPSPRPSRAVRTHHASISPVCDLSLAFARRFVGASQRDELNVTIARYTL